MQIIVSEDWVGRLEFNINKLNIIKIEVTKYWVELRETRVY